MNPILFDLNLSMVMSLINNDSNKHRISKFFLPIENQKICRSNKYVDLINM